MPCFTRWDEWLKEGTPEYDRAKTEVEAKLRSVKHIVNYYYHAARFSVPAVDSDVPHFLKDASATEEEARLLEIIAHHFACDEIDVGTLYDVCSLLSAEVPADRAYSRIIHVCANEIRGRRGDFEMPDSEKWNRRPD